MRASPDGTYADGDDSTWMTVDWPSLTRDGDRCWAAGSNVIDTGGYGPPLLFLHGLGGLWQNWLLNIPAFMGSFRVVAPDLPGFGRSEMPSGRISIQGFARVIDALCDRLEISDPGRRRQLDGRLHRRRAGDRVPDAGAQARADLGGRDLGREHVARAGHGRRAG